MSTSKITPVRRQYLQIKAQYPDAIVFFRLGDFYETFDDDAEIVAHELGLTLTSRNVAKGQRVPMAGVPYHAAEQYIAQLIEKGYKVAIAEQVGEADGRTLMKREVTRVVTAGTVIEPDMLDARRNNYLVALIREPEHTRAGLAYVDITTGEFAVTQIVGETLDELERRVQEELERLQPAEVLVPAERERMIKGARPAERREGGFRTTEYDAWHWETSTARQALLDHFEVRTLDGFGCEQKPAAIRAAGAIVQYLQETQRNALAQLRQLYTYSTDHFMTLDAATRRNLELTESIGDQKKRTTLLNVLDATHTPMGGRLLRRWLNQPLLNRDAIEARLDAVEAFYTQTEQRMALRETLKTIGDLERLTNRVVSGLATPRELGAMRETLRRLPDVRAIVADLAERQQSLGRPVPKPLEAERLDVAEDVLALLDAALVDDPPSTRAKTGFIRPSFSNELQDLIEKSRHAREWIAGLEQVERERTGIKSLKVGYNKVFGYYIEVTKANTHLVPDEYIRKQTLVNAERYITPELKEYETLVLNAEERQLDLENRLFEQVMQQVAAQAPRLLRTARLLARLDVFSALAEVAVRRRYVRPRLHDGDAIRIVNGRHPVVEVMMKDEPFIPNDTEISGEAFIHIITGPNMAGKSTYLRQVALIVLMAQIGSFVPADEADIGLVDRIFTRVGAHDEIARGQSTFMVEMVETANILNHATNRSLLVLDEIGRGTSTYDGISIAWAVVEYIHNNPKLRSRTLFATHYHELTELEKRLPHVRNYNVAVVEEEGRVVFLHKIVPGAADRSYGIHVAAIAGLPRSVIKRAQEILADLEAEARAPGGHRERVRSLVAGATQLPLFAEPEPSPVEEELKQINVDELSPLEALNLLYRLQQLAKSRE